MSHVASPVDCVEEPHSAHRVGLLGMTCSSRHRFLKSCRRLPILSRVGHINDDPHNIVPIKKAAVAPVTLDFLGLVTGRTKTVYNLQHRLSEPIRRHVPAVIEPDGPRPSNRRHLLLIGSLSLDDKWNVLVGEDFQGCLRDQMFAGAERPPPRSAQNASARFSACRSGNVIVTI